MARDISGNATDYIAVPDHAVWDASDDLTIGIWARPDDLANFDQLFSRWDEGPGKRVWSLAVDEGGGTDRLRFDTSPDGAFSAGNTVNAVSALSLSVWTHVVCTHDSANTRNRIYIGGTLNATKTAVAAGLFDTDIGLKIGSGNFNGGVNQFFDGRLADAAVWKVVLSDDEIAALAKGASPHVIRPGSLIGYWPLWGVAYPEPDLSGNGNNGTQTGTVPAIDHAPVGRPVPSAT